MSLPVLSTERIRLEPVSDRHLSDLVALNSDAEVMAFQLGRPATPEETAAEWKTRLVMQSDPVRGLGYWAGNVGGKFVGWWSASTFAGLPAQSGVGYRLCRDAWGSGLATEGARAMVGQAFSVPGVERVVASTRAANTRSRRVLEKVGLQHVAAQHKQQEDLLSGDREDVVYVLELGSWLDSGRVANGLTP
ncbi:GNAT family N-acetyltransferase [Nocardioides sp. NPDC058538]|uniref:GNAT family N-acetyltransferase n=1 Tax=Nocardioides sp. NPDC058538 TaxID=3346542 RepID=UPI0036571CC7